MANITRYSPLGELLTRDSPFNELFSDLSRDWFAPMRFERQPQQLAIRLDVNEDDKSYIVRAEIPGVKKDDIKVSVEGNQVSISAELKKEKQEKEGEKVLRSERYYGSAYRSFSLDRDIEEGEVQAKYTDGILTLNLPKKKGKPTKNVPIS